MPELIDRVALLKKCIEGDGNDKFTEGYNFAVQEISAYITLAPTIEPEVRHGRWVVNVRNPDYADCTNCGLSEWLGANGSREYAETLLSGFKKFCPNCGARMDGGAGNVSNV